MALSPQKRSYSSSQTHGLLQSVVTQGPARPVYCEQFSDKNAQLATFVVGQSHETRVIIWIKNGNGKNDPC